MTSFLRPVDVMVVYCSALWGFWMLIGFVAGKGSYVGWREEKKCGL